MTEAEWLACTDPTPMLEFLRGKVSDRKLRLFSCACCRGIWHLLQDDRSRQAVEVAEEYADGLTTRNKLMEAHTFTDDLAQALLRGYSLTAIHRAVPVTAAKWATASRMGKAVVYVVNCIVGLADAGEAMDVERANLARLLREIFGNSLHPATIAQSNLARNDATVRKIAQAIYEERTFDRMPILADALEDAGCDNADILNHCREPGEHVRGCWVVDLLLGKE